MRWKTLATLKLAEVEALAVRVETMKTLLAEALRCGCVDLTACGRLLQAVRPGGSVKEPQRNQLPAERRRRAR